MELRFPNKQQNQTNAKGTLMNKELQTKGDWSCVMSKQEAGNRKDGMEGVCCHM